MVVIRAGAVFRERGTPLQTLDEQDWSSTKPALFSSLMLTCLAQNPRRFKTLNHARPFVGVFQKSIFTRFINFWQYFPTKTNQWLQERTWDTPTKGLLWPFLDRGTRPSVRVDIAGPLQVVNVRIYDVYHSEFTQVACKPAGNDL